MTYQAMVEDQHSVGRKKDERRKKKKEVMAHLADLLGVHLGE